MKNPPSKTLLTSIYYGAFVILGLTTASLGPTLGALASLTQSSLHAISVLFTARGLGYLAGSFQIGKWYDRRPGHPVMAGALAAMGLTMALSPVQANLSLLTAVMFLLGTAEGALDVGGNLLLGWIHGSGVGPYMNALHFFYGVGAFLSPLIATQAISLGGVSWAYWALAVPALPAVLLLGRLPSPPHQRPSPQEGEKSGEDRLAILMSVFFFLYVGAEVGFGGWIFTYAKTLGFGGGATAAYLNSAFWGAFTLGRLAGIPLAARLKPQTLLWWDIGGCLGFLVLILAFPQSLAALWAGTLGVGLAMASIFPTLMILAGNTLNLSGRVTGWFLTGSGAGAMFLPWLIGQGFEGIGPWVTMVAVGIALTLSLGVLGWYLALARSMTIRNSRLTVPSDSPEVKVPADS